MPHWKDKLYASDCPDCKIARKVKLDQCPSCGKVFKGNKPIIERMLLEQNRLKRERIQKENQKKDEIKKKLNNQLSDIEILINNNSFDEAKKKLNDILVKARIINYEAAIKRAKNRLDYCTYKISMEKGIPITQEELTKKSLIEIPIEKKQKTLLVPNRCPFCGIDITPNKTICHRCGYLLKK